MSRVALKFDVPLEELRAMAPGFWYVATPYSKYPGGIFTAYDMAVAVRGWLSVQRIPNFLPIVHSHPVAIACGLDPLDHNIWLPDDAPFMTAAGGLIVVKMDGWDTSYGIEQETAAFAAAGKPIHYAEVM